MASRYIVALPGNAGEFTILAVMSVGFRQKPLEAARRGAALCKSEGGAAWRKMANPAGNIHHIAYYPAGCSPGGRRISQTHLEGPHRDPARGNPYPVRNSTARRRQHIAASGSPGRQNWCRLCRLSGSNSPFHLRPAMTNPGHRPIVWLLMGPARNRTGRNPPNAAIRSHRNRVAALDGKQHPLGAREIRHLANFHALLPD